MWYLILFQNSKKCTRGIKTKLRLLVIPVSKVRFFFEIQQIKQFEETVAIVMGDLLLNPVGENMSKNYPSEGR